MVGSNRSDPCRNHGAAWRDPRRSRPRPRLNESGLRQLPVPERFPPVNLAHFKSTDARLPHPGAAGTITPAHTNKLSGAGTFENRTRRAERFWRTFGYDRVNDAIVVFDQVT